MIYQIDGKIVNTKPTGKFKKVVIVPGRLMNFLTKERDINCLDMTIERHVGFHHVAEVQEKGEVTYYVDGAKVEVING